MLIEDALADLGCEVVGVASRFDDGLSKARTLAFDIAILDVNLNGLRDLPDRRNPSGPRHPFVFATGYGPPASRDGLNDVPILQKPFATRDLEQALRAALDLAPKTRHAALVLLCNSRCSNSRTTAAGFLPLGIPPHSRLTFDRDGRDGEIGGMRFRALLFAAHCSPRLFAPKRSAAVRIVERQGRPDRSLSRRLC